MLMNFMYLILSDTKDSVSTQPPLQLLQVLRLSEAPVRFEVEALLGEMAQVD